MARFVLWCVLSLCGSVVSARAQDRPPPSRPVDPAAILLLTREAPAIDAERLRTRLAELLDGEVGREPGPQYAAWVRTDRGRLVVVCRGRHIFVTTGSVPRELSESAVAHLLPAEREMLRGHRGFVRIERTEAPGPRRRDLVDDYRALAAAAGALLDDNVIGLGARTHGTFDPVNEYTGERLRGTDPLAALAPRATTSLAILRATRASFEAESLAASLGKEFDRPFLARQAADGDSADFVACNGPRYAVLRSDGRFVFLWISSRFTPDAATEARPAGVEDALARHESVLHVRTAGAVDDAAEGERRRLVARVAHALWSDDCLALSWSCEPVLVASTPGTPRALRSPDPVGETLGTREIPVVVARAEDTELVAATATARKTWSVATAHLEAGGDVSAKFPFATRSGAVEHLWIDVTSVEDGKVRGVVGNEPIDVAGIELGTEVACDLGELSDWLYFENGEMVGGHTVRVLMRRRAEEERAREKAEAGGGEKGGADEAGEAGEKPAGSGRGSDDRAPARTEPTGGG